MSGAAKFASDAVTLCASEPADTESRLPLNAPPRTLTAPWFAPPPVYAAASCTSIALPVERLAALIPRTVPAVVLSAESFASVPANAPVLANRASDARLPEPANAPVPLTSSPRPCVPPVPTEAPTSTFTALPVVSRPVPTVTALTAPTMPEPAVNVTALAVEVFPRSVTSPVLVSKVPVASEKSSFPVPAAALKFLFAATVVSPRSVTAPVLVSNVPLDSLKSKLPVEAADATTLWLVVIVVPVTFRTSTPATWKRSKLPVNPPAALA